MIAANPSSICPPHRRRLLVLALSFVSLPLHAATFYVATNGTNTASGGFSTPWATISRAASTMNAGDTALIRAGTYRETVTPAHSGSSTSSRITYQAYPGETPVISGADVFANWTWDTSGSPNAWKLPWTTNLAPSITNASTDPTVLRREMVIFDSQVMLPVGSRAALAAGDFYVDGPPTNPLAIYALFPGNVAPAGHVVEAATRSHAFDGSSKNYLVINGLTFRYACNVVQDLMVQIDGSATGVLFENNTVEWANAGGLSAAGNNNIFSNNVVQNNGQLGFADSGSNNLYDHNKSLGNNWKGYDAGWEAGGGKWVYTTSSTIRFHEAGNNIGPGIWLDTDNVNNLIEKCLVYSNTGSGIFLKLNSTGNTVRNNVVCAPRFTPNYP